MEPIKQELFKQAVAQARAGQREEARRTFVQLAKEYPTNTKILLWLVYTGKDTNLSERLLARVAQLEPDNKALPAARQWLEGLKTASVTAEEPMPAAFGQEPQTLSPQFVSQELAIAPVSQPAQNIPNFSLLEASIEQPYRDPPPPPLSLSYPAGKTSQNVIFTTLRTSLKVGGYILSGILFYLIFWGSRNNIDTIDYSEPTDNARFPSFALPRNLSSTELNISRSKCLENSTFLVDMDLKPDELEVLDFDTYCYSINATTWQTYLDYYDRLMKRVGWESYEESSKATRKTYYSSLGGTVIEYVGENKAGGYQLKTGEGLLIVLVIKERGRGVAYKNLSQ